MIASHIYYLCKSLIYTSRTAKKLYVAGTQKGRSCRVCSIKSLPPARMHVILSPLECRSLGQDSHMETTQYTECRRARLFHVISPLVCRSLGANARSDWLSPGVMTLFGNCHRSEALADITQMSRWEEGGTRPCFPGRFCTESYG